MERIEAERLLKRAVNDSDATFHPGQWESIDALVNQRRKLLVVQRTGWGKSSVYFISTRILRDNGAGPTLIVSPLLALMRNQLEAASRLGVQAATINSSNMSEWESVRRLVLQNRVDALLISPERLSNERFIEDVLLPIADRIGLLVVDEAHCISDWGHDFRPDYRRLVGILQQMPPNMPVLGTTATANDRVIQDVQEQLGSLDIQRGTLARESLNLMTMRLPNPKERMAWLAQHIPNMPGTGIIYVLRRPDAEQVSAWLLSQNIEAHPYHGGHTTVQRLNLEDMLLNNRVKALVATTALGMGYDKPDLGFVVHYQAPSSVIHYYQHVGRAGRAIEKAYGILLTGIEDGRIHEYFRDSDFPTEWQARSVLDALEQSDGLSTTELDQLLNMRRNDIDKTLKYLSVENPSPVAREGMRWRRTPIRFQMNRSLIQRLTRQKEVEWWELQKYVDSDTCLMAYLRNALDDTETEDCGICSVCLEWPASCRSVDRNFVIAAYNFLHHSEMPFRPKGYVPVGALQSYNIVGNLRNYGLMASEGRILSRWQDAGWGREVAYDKQYTGNFRDDLIEAVADMYEKRWRPSPAPQWVTCVPSQNNPSLVPDFAQRLANRLGLEFVDAIQKIRNNQPQKNQQNSFHQCRNLDGAFAVSDSVPRTPVLLVDDIIDSGWTVTVLAALLRRNGSGPVYPVALASTTPGG